MEEYFDIVINWMTVNKTPLKWSGIAFLLSFISLGALGALFYFPASLFYSVLGLDAVTDKLHGDKIWPMLILMSLLASLLVVPAHLFITAYIPDISGWQYIWSVIATIWLTGVVTNILLIYYFSRLP